MLGRIRNVRHAIKRPAKTAQPALRASGRSTVARSARLYHCHPHQILHHYINRSFAIIIDIFLIHKSVVIVNRNIIIMKFIIFTSLDIFHTQCKHDAHIKFYNGVLKMASDKQRNDCDWSYSPRIKDLVKILNEHGWIRAPLLPSFFFVGVCCCCYCKITKYWHILVLDVGWREYW